MRKTLFVLGLTLMSTIFFFMIGCDQNEPPANARQHIVEITQKTKPPINPAPVISDVHYSARPVLLKDEKRTV